MSKSNIYSTQSNGAKAITDFKTFEICLDHEPTLNEIQTLQREAISWQGLKVIKLCPSVTHSEKIVAGKFWILSFHVHETDWIFWCGFCAGKKWAVLNNGQSELREKQKKEIGNWLVQI